MRSLRTFTPVRSGRRSRPDCPAPRPRRSADKAMSPAAEAIERFAADFDALSPAESRVGLAVSGGPDSLALLLLAAAARPGRIEAATVDHRLRPDSRKEADFVADVCHRLGVPHKTLAVSVKPGASLQAQARSARYEALGEWAIN